ncbi:MAG: MOSC domain-containing protein [Proteobacteria bacterium]|nr:MOSC domain-containing protein [Pseudomonadota bacterium]MDA1357194.1 MOSC domain-containing protein [Pseudomonadota bacterium]
MTSQSNAVGTIQNIWRYAVKSMGGEELGEALVTEGGLLGDRGYAVIDQANGKVGSAKMPKKWGSLLTLSSAYSAPPSAGAPLPPVQINWPGGESVISGGGDIDARLSETVGRPVALTTVRPETVSLERMDPLEAEETILDIGEIMMAGRFSDYAAIHLLTTATLARLSELSPGIAFDAKRFRPNLIIEAAEGRHGFVENDWVGRTVAIGKDVRLHITDPTPRCLIPTQAQHGGIEKDMKIVSTIVEHNSLPVPVLDNEVLPCVGVYGFVLKGGDMRQGDTIRVE